MTSRVDNADLASIRVAPPKVKAYELAAALKVSPPVLSDFENCKRDELPDGRGREDYLRELAVLKARKRGDGEAS